MIVEEFISKEERKFPFKIGSLIASSLAGFLAGLVFGGLALWFIFWAISQRP